MINVLLFSKLFSCLVLFLVNQLILVFLRTHCAASFPSLLPCLPHHNPVKQILTSSSIHCLCSPSSRFLNPDEAFSNLTSLQPFIPVLCPLCKCFERTSDTLRGCNYPLTFDLIHLQPRFFPSSSDSELTSPSVQVPENSFPSPYLLVVPFFSNIWTNDLFTPNTQSLPQLFHSAWPSPFHTLNHQMFIVDLGISGDF